MSKHEIEKLDRLSTMLDSNYRIPFTPIRFGWDFVIGLVPGVGDVATLGPSAFLIYKAYKLGARKRTIGRMSVNTGLDFFVGTVPILGDAFDLFFKANNRNFTLLKRELARRPSNES
ncbi:DUF4112 domain-containing protein [Sulfitobacter sp. F26169L]|uniref:DUF4112 domain-containing protein n=1 Tax=Sulfitobacter sp. F26169L TaxID=2996015 RepID=UPI002260C5AE|nr:DUF4112 domain-containing protein [Sulfitobacter sp. F26169L]MCX7568188.1 DUF4112 domain-containing protein [Sulfitobacter sp. F26169L]